MPPRPRIEAVEPTVQTTVRFPHSLLKRARVRAAVDEVTLQSLVIAGLDAELRTLFVTRVAPALEAEGKAAGPLSPARR